VLELRNLIQQEIQTNPTLEEESTDLSLEDKQREHEEFQEEFERLAKLDEEWRDYMAQNTGYAGRSAEEEERRQFFFDSLVREETLQQHLFEQVGSCDLPVEDRKVAELVIEYRDRGVVGFDIAGAEAGYPPTRHLDAFHYLQRENSHFTIHAGEAFGLPSIWEAIQLCGAERLGHGVRIIDDIDLNHTPARLGKLAAYVRDRRIPLEMCPSSNIQTGAAANFADHPIGDLAKLRFRVTVNTDNRLMSATSMTREMNELVKAFNWSFLDLQRVTINALKSAFIPFEERLAIIDQIVKPGYAKISAE
jgi:hypothetical protein